MAAPRAGSVGPVSSLTAQGNRDRKRQQARCARRQSANERSAKAESREVCLDGQGESEWAP